MVRMIGRGTGDFSLRRAAIDREAELERELAAEILANRCGSGVAEGLPLAAEGTGASKEVARV